MQERHGFAHLAQATQARREGHRQERASRASLQVRAKIAAWRLARRLGIPTGTTLVDWVREHRIS